MKKAVFCWSGGKDSSLALHKVIQAKEFEVKYLLCTLNETFRRISMHGVREALLEKQAESIGIPLVKMYVNEGTNAEYERNMKQLLLRFKSEGIDDVIFGDIFLEDLRAYRDNNLAKVNMRGVYPLWKQDTRQLISEFLSLGFKTITCCVNDAHLDENSVGKVISEDFVRSLPSTVDPCGENGEFHTFCYDGPIFQKAIEFTTGEKVYRPLDIKTSDCQLPASPTKGFWYCELIGRN